MEEWGNSSIPEFRGWIAEGRQAAGMDRNTPPIPVLSSPVLTNPSRLRFRDDPRDLPVNDPAQDREEKVGVFLAQRNGAGAEEMLDNRVVASFTEIS